MPMLGSYREQKMESTRCCRVMIATRLMVGLDDQQTSILALRTCVWLQRNGVVTGGCAQTSLRVDRSFRDSQPFDRSVRMGGC